MKYQKMDEKLSAEDIKEMLIKNSRKLKYSRINITIPTSLKKKVATYFEDEPRSTLITRLLLEKVSEKEKEEFLKEQAEILGKNQHLYKDVFEDFEEASLEDLNRPS